MPQYLPVNPMQGVQPIQPRLSQPISNIFPSYGQFPSTYPYNTLNPQLFQQPTNLQTNLPLQNIQPDLPSTIDPSAGIYAPIPFASQLLQQKINMIQPQPLQQEPQQQINDQTNGTNNLNSAQVIPEIPKSNINRGIYKDDTREAKRAKVEFQRTYSHCLY
jgi:hypothetical protein